MKPSAILTLQPLVANIIEGFEANSGCNVSRSLRDGLVAVAKDLVLESGTFLQEFEQFCLRALADRLEDLLALHVPIRRGDASFPRNEHEQMR